MQASPHKVEAGGLGDPKEGGMISPIGCSPSQNKPHCSFCQPWVPAVQQAPSPSACASPQCTTGSVTFVELYALFFHLCRSSGVVFLASRWLPWPCSPADCPSARCSPNLFNSPKACHALAEHVGLLLSQLAASRRPAMHMQSTWICCSASKQLHTNPAMHMQSAWVSCSASRQPYRSRWMRRGLQHMQLATRKPKWPACTGGTWRRLQLCSSSWRCCSSSSRSWPGLRCAGACMSRKVA